MRISFLILCLAVVCGAYRTSEHEENIDLIEGIQTPVKELRLLGHDSDIISKTKTDLTKSIFSVMIEQAKCPKIELNLIWHPSEMFEALRCHGGEIIKSLVHALMRKVSNLQPKELLENIISV